MASHNLSIMILLLFTVHLYGSGKATNITINPTVQAFDSLPEIKKNVSFYVGAVIDSLMENPPNSIGKTRIARQVFAPIVCDPSPSASIKKSMENLLSLKGILAGDASTANFVIQITIRGFSLKEMSKVFTQTMDANVKLEVCLVDPLDASNMRKFVIETSNTKTAMDTTEYAEEIIRGALQSALVEILKSI